LFILKTYSVPVTNLPIAMNLGFDSFKALVLDSVDSLESKRAYDKGISDFIAWRASTNPHNRFNKAAVQSYRAHLIEVGLAPSTINVRMSAIRRLAAEAADNGLLDPVVASGVSRIKGVKNHGRRTGNWLTVEQAEKLINAPGTTTLKGKRDRALLAVLIGCGLRREETALLILEHIQQREGRWVIVDMKGKGGRIRTIPIPS